jgi:hypothetical protein
MHFRHGSQLFGFLVGAGVAKKISASDFRTSKILEQVRSSERRMKLDVEMGR